MDAERLRRAATLFDEALDRSPEERSAYLNAVCGCDVELRFEVESLLRFHEAGGGVLEEAAVKRYDELLATLNTTSGLTGQSIGPYRILRLLGAGGMGEVWLAEDTRLARQVALKLLPDSLAHDPELARRLTQEAHAASALNHPNIITVYDVGQFEKRFYIVSEYVEGESLREKVRSGPLSITKTIEIACQVADALAAAHIKGIIHRDIKPENIMLRPDGRVKVLDFGIAKRIGGVASECTLKETSPGAVMGTMAYLSPEQARGLPVDQRTDVWSLGVVLYELISGGQPFTGESASDVLAAILTQEPLSLEKQCPNLDPCLVHLVSWTFCKDLPQRCPTANVLHNELLACYSRVHPHNPITHTTKESNKSFIKGRQASLIKLMIVLTSIVGPMVLVASMWLTRWQIVTPSTFQQFTVARLTNNGAVKTAAVSSNGRYIAYAAEEGSGQALWLKQVGVSPDQQRMPIDNVQYKGITFSPDDTKLYFVVERTGSNIGLLYTVPLLGGVARQILDDVDTPPTVSPDGRQIAFIRVYVDGSIHLIVANSNGEEARSEASWSPPTRLEYAPAWSPDGTTIVCGVSIVLSTGASQAQFTAINTSTNRSHVVITQRWSWFGRPVWFGGSTSLVVPAIPEGAVFPQLMLLAYPSGKVREFTHDLNGYTEVASSQDGRTLVALQTDRLSSLWVAASDHPDKVQRLTHEGSRYYDVSWTPDGHVISMSNAGGKPELWEINTNDGKEKPLTDEGSNKWGPSCSPDGQSVTFYSNRSGSWNVWQMNRDGSHLHSLTTGPGPDNFPRFSPDSQWVLYSSQAAGRSTLWKVPVKGGIPVQLTTSLSHSPVPSPDGRWLACITSSDLPGASWQVAILSAQDRVVSKILSKVPPFTGFKWLPDSSGLTYIKTHNGVSNIWSQSLVNTIPTQLTHFDDLRIFAFDWSVNQKQIAFVRGNSAVEIVLLQAR